VIPVIVGYDWMEVRFEFVLLELFHSISELVILRYIKFSKLKLTFSELFWYVYF
jgi:hypothetical protein